MKLMKSALVSIFIVFLIISTSSLKSQSKTTEINLGITLDLKTNSGGVRPDYCDMIAVYLRELGIEVNVIVEEWSVFLGTTLLLTHNYDIGVVALSGGGAYPGSKNVWTTTGSLNIFGLGPDIPYQNESEVYQTQQETMVDPDERQAYLYEWQQLVMNKIVPILPLFASSSYVVTTADTLGFDNNWGIIDSLPYIEFTGAQYGQDEFTIADVNWIDLNPLIMYDGASGFLSRLISEPIVGWSPDLAPLKTALVTNWEQNDEFHFKFNMRDNVYWNPSFYVVDRDPFSSPLDPYSTPLMSGLKNGEVSDGANQQVTAKDAVFTYLAWANPIVSENPNYHNWISACYVDPVDPLAFHIEIDGNPETLENEFYADFWTHLTYSILPEFFLNSTNPTISYTLGGAKCVGLYDGIYDSGPWMKFSESAFGCGKYMLDYSSPYSETVLQASPYWMNIGIKNGTYQDLDIATVIVKYVPDSTHELEEFQDGDLDVADVTGFPAERKIMQDDPHYDVQSKLQNSMTFMFYNLQRNFISDISSNEFLTTPGKEEYTKGVALRKAINYAIDRDEMNQELHDGEYLVANSVIYPYTAFYYYNDIIKYNYDLDASVEWLDALYFTSTIISTIAHPNITLFVISITIASIYISKIKRRRR